MINLTLSYNSFFFFFHANNMLKELNHYFTVQSELQGQICEEIKGKKK